MVSLIVDVLELKYFTNLDLYGVFIFGPVKNYPTNLLSLKDHQIEVEINSLKSRTAIDVTPLPLFL